MDRIVTTIALPDDVADHLTAIGEVRGPDDWQIQLPGASAVIASVGMRIDRELLGGADRLRIVANAAVGYDNIDVGACAERGIVVTNTPGVLTGATADLTMALLLATVRRLPQAERALRAGEFQGWGFWDHLGGDLDGATIGIYGIGRIGQAFARRARGFDVSLQYHSRSRLSAEIERDLAISWVDRETLLASSDVLSLHAPYTPGNHHLLDRAALRRMKKGSYLINTARGALVNETALVSVLRDGPLAGAGLDVYENEPEIHPGLLELPNVVLLPHIGSAAPGTRRAMAMLAARNVVAVLTGAEPLTPVT